MKKAIQTNDAPPAIGPYSQAIELGEWLFCSGQIGLDPGTGTMVKGGVQAETRRALENLNAVLQAAGVWLDDIVKTTIFLVDLREFEAVNRIYGEYLRAPYPARSTVQVAALPRGARIEIEALARRRS
jgi:2-iminobutanoate/2-iminopropanoate deaminase